MEVRDLAKPWTEEELAILADPDLTYDMKFERLPTRSKRSIFMKMREENYAFKRSPGIPWTDEEISIISDASLTDREKAERLPDRTLEAVRTYRIKGGFVSRLEWKPWTKGELTILGDPTLTDREKVEMLSNRTEAAVLRQRAMKGFKSKLEGNFTSWTDEELEIIGDPNLTDKEKIDQLPHRHRDSIKYQIRARGFISKPREKKSPFVFVTVDGKTDKRYRIVATEKLGRPLKENEDVHHINMDNTDDRPENLWIGTRSKHKKLHGTLNSIVKELMERGIVGFNRESKEYFIFPGAFNKLAKLP